MSKLTIHDLTEKELLILYREFDRRKRSPVITWLLWLFLFGVHRLYLGDKDYSLAVSQIGFQVFFLFVLFITVVGVWEGVWWYSPVLGLGIVIWRIIDAFLIPRKLLEDKHQVEEEILEELAARRRRPNRGVLL